MIERKSKNRLPDKMLAARTAKLAGTSPREIGLAKTRQALDWIYRWGAASATTIDALSGVARRGLAARLVKQGLLAKTRTESGGAKGVPQYFLTLTRAGVEEVERWRADLLPYETDPYRVRQQLLRHSELAQRATANSLLKGTINGYQTEKEAATASAAGIKQPDVVWQLPDGQLMAVEVELSAKWRRDFDQFIFGCIEALARPPDGRARFDRLAFITDSPAILRRYKAAFAPGAAFGQWKKDQHGRWQLAGSHVVPTWMGGKVTWRLLEN